LDRLRRRQQDIREIENVVTETTNIFQTLATIVNEQGETVSNIENNIDAANEKVVEGTVEIRRARDYHVSMISFTPFYVRLTCDLI
jgi:t-SNARE complex subunit (syntaxin)